MHVEDHKGFIFAPPFMAAFWLVPALSQEQGATAGYVSAVDDDFIRDRRSYNIIWLIRGSCVQRTQLIH